VLTYGGVPLCQPTAQVEGWIQQNISLADVYEFARIHWPSDQSKPWKAPQTVPQEHPIRVNELFWPWGARRWAIGHFLVTDNQLAKIRPQAYSGPNRYKALPLVIGDERTDANKITTDLWMLPPRPLAQISNTNGMHLLTLVDERYFWWAKTVSLTITEGTTAWTDVILSIESALGTSITKDTVNAAYLKPTAELAVKYEYLPTLLDDVAGLVGQRVVRNLAGVISTQNPLTAKTKQDNQFGDWAKFAGGAFAFHPSFTHDLEALVPQQVTVIFPNVVGGVVPGTEIYSITYTLQNLGLAQFPAPVMGYAGAKFIRSGEGVNYTSGAANPDNFTNLDNLAKQLATDFYLWQLGKNHIAYAGIVPYVPEAISDILWVYRQDQVATKVLRGPWNDPGPLEIHHCEDVEIVRIKSTVKVGNYYDAVIQKYNFTTGAWEDKEDVWVLDANG
jgi:hypothetical protein